MYMYLFKMCLLNFREDDFEIIIRELKKCYVNSSKI